MATSRLDHPPPLRAPPPRRSHREARAGLPATLVLTVTLAVGALAVLISAALLVVHPDMSILTNRFGDQQNQSAKTALYLLAFAVVLPAALVAGPRLADRVAAGPNAPGLDALAGLLATGLVAFIAAVKTSTRLPWGSGLGVLLVAAGLWWMVAIAVLARATRPAPWPPLLRAARRTVVLWGVATGGVLVALLCVSPLHGNLLRLAIAALAVAGLVVAAQRMRVPGVPRRYGLALDVAAVVLILLAVPDVVIFTISGDPVDPFTPPGILQFHHDFLLGPTNQLLGGGALLVGDPVSQYGVGFIYFLAGWFHLVPIGYGTYGLLDGIVTALFYTAAYVVLRTAGVSRLLAAGALTVGVVALVYTLTYPVGGLPEQGPLRFGLPMGVLLAFVAAGRHPRRAGAWRALGLSVLGVSAIWAFESFAYTTMTYAALVLVAAWLRPHDGRRLWLAQHAALAVAACLAAHGALAVATLLGTGHMPDWGQYLAYVHAFVLGGKAGEVTYGFQPWSPGLALGIAYLASAAAVWLLARRHADAARRHPETLLTLTGATVYGIALFSYTDNRSSTYLLPYVAVPALIAVTAWLSLALRADSEVPRAVRLGALGLVASVAGLLLAVAWPVAGDRFADSALAKVRPGGHLGDALHRLWHLPPIDPRAPAGQRLLGRYMPGERRSLVLLPLAPDLSTEVLMRSGRANALPLGDPKADGFVPTVWMPIIRPGIARLRPGRRVLLDRTGAALFATLARQPGRDVFAEPLLSGNPLDEWILQQIGRRFSLRLVAHDRSGLVVAQLARRARGS
jgi:hypothetical protein